MQQLSTYVRECLNDSELELEARFTFEVNEEKFKRLLSRYLTADKPKPVTTLDIRWDKDEKHRYTIEGEQAIKTYCQSETITKAKIIEKVNLPDKRPISQEPLPIRWNLKREVETKNGNIPVFKDEKGTWRLKNRWSFMVHDYIRMDLTLVKQNQGTKFLPKKTHTYEVELEFVQSEAKKQEKEVDTLVEELQDTAREILLVLEDLKVWMSRPEQETILTKYLTCLRRMYTIKNIRAEEARAHPQKYQPNRQPSTLEMKNVHELFEDDAYTVTEKADGERMVGFILDTKLYLLNTRLDVMNPDITVADKSECILDGEWVNKEYYTFDMYMDNGKAINSLPLNERLDALKALGETIKRKDFLPFSEFPKIVHHTDKYPYHIDGYIFTPNDPKRTTYKWKPPQENTIDFLVRFEPPEAGTDTCLVNLYVSTPSGRSLVDILVSQRRMESPNEYVPELFARAKFPIRNGESILRCEDDSVISNDSIIECRYEAQSWTPMRVRRDKSALYKRNGNIRSAANARLTAISVLNSITNPVLLKYLTREEPLPEKNSIIEDQDTYYEMSGTRDQDKTWKAISRFHNQVKRELLAKARTESLSTKTGNRSIDQYKPTLWDISCGRGGDLAKWIDNHYGKVVGTDLFGANLKDSRDGAYGRLRQYVNKNAPPILFFQLDAKEPWSKSLVQAMTHETKDMAHLAWGLESPLQNYQELKNHFQNIALNKTVDVVSCQFSIHYFFDNVNNLKQVLTNVASLLRNGGIFVGTCMDGKEVFQALSADNTMQGGDNPKDPAWKIVRGYDPETLNGSELPFGLPIQVYLKSTKQTLQEYLVDLNVLSRMAGEQGMTLLETKSFEQYDNFYRLTDAERAFSRLHKSFAFRYNAK